YCYHHVLLSFPTRRSSDLGIFSIIAVLAAVDSLDRNIKDKLSGLDKNTIYLTKYSFGPTQVPRWQRDHFPQTTHEDFEYIKRSVDRKSTRLNSSHVKISYA